MKKFNYEEFKELYNKACPMDCEIKTYHNKNHVSFTRNDSIISMSFRENEISSIVKRKGNYYVFYVFHPNLNIKSKQEFIVTISRSGNTQIGIEKEFDENGNIVNQINWDEIPYDTNIPGPKKSIWEISQQLKIDFNFDILNNKDLFSIQQFQNAKTKKIDYSIKKFINHEKNILKLMNYNYDGETGKLISKEILELDIPENLPHY